LRLEVKKRGIDKTAKDFNIPPNRSVFSLDSPKLRLLTKKDKTDEGTFFDFFPAVEDTNKAAVDAGDPKDFEPKVQKYFF
jgi:hypothetical protein